MNKHPSLVDTSSGTTYSIDQPRWCAPDGRPLLVEELPGISRSAIDFKERSIWRYKNALPIPIEDPVSLGEGCTPLVNVLFGGLECKCKLEWFSPTGSFKDRGTSVMISLLKQQGISSIIEDSSGNGGASVAAYGAAAGMAVTIYVPASTQPAKIAQIKAYGAAVVSVEGPREATESAAMEAAANVFYASHNWHPFFLQGTKSLGYEIWEDLGYSVPDNLVIPGSAGSNVLGCYFAFKELMRSGETDRMPRIFVSQPANCSPLHTSFQSGSEDYVESMVFPTVAEGTAIRRPIRLREMIGALKATNGGTVVSTEQEIIDASFALAQRGLYVEPTSAQAASGFMKLIESGAIREDEVTVALLTGSGLKATAFYTDQLE
ncbi:MAG: pyridoxal-phosphate dependent enzyme [Halioglobus sp.]